MKKLFCVFIIIVAALSCSPRDAEPETTAKEQYPDCLSTMDTSASQDDRGCDNIFLFKSIKEGILTVWITKDSVELDGQCNTYSVGGNIKVNLEIYPSDKRYKDSVRAFNYCTCLHFGNAQKKANASCCVRNYYRICKIFNPIRRNSY